MLVDFQLKVKTMPTLEQAILDTVAYADIFQYPMTQAEVHFYLTGVKASPTEVYASLDYIRSRLGLLDFRDGYYTLPGRIGLVTMRQERRQTAARMWPEAIHYGRLISRLPFVRMVAVTGSLSMDNVDPQADLDYFIVTRQGRLWLTRAMVILLVRWAAIRGTVLCPNYFLSENSLALEDRNLFTAHELVQMIPISGLSIYARMRLLNSWVIKYLPNARNTWQTGENPDLKQSFLQRTGEFILQAPIFNRLEKWEMDRKIRKFTKIFDDHPEAVFDRDRCKGHFDDHENQVLEAFLERENILQEELR
jgi:hypothetical protein